MSEYRIDDLARASGTTTRNIRGYQERGLLPQPMRRGRVAIYTERHLAKLRVINKLLGNGFNLRHIATFLTDPRAQIGEALDLPELLDAQWSARRPVSMTRADLDRRLGPVGDDTLDALVAAGVVRRGPDADEVEVVDPKVVDNFAELVDRGMSLATLIEVHREVADRLADAARVLMQAAHDELIRRRGAGWTPTDPEDVAWVTDLLGVMRRTGTENAYAALDRALDDARDGQLRVHTEAVVSRETTASATE